MNPAYRLVQVSSLILVTYAAGLASGQAASGQTEPGPPSATPPWKRQLGAEAASRVEKQEQQIAQMRREGKFSQAIEPAREVAEVRARLQGADHWQAADARRAVADLRKIAALPEEGRRALASTEDLAPKAKAERRQVHYSEAVTTNRALLEIRRKWLGDDHPSTADTYSELAYNLEAQGKYAESEPLHRKALAVWLAAVGPVHPDTARGCRYVGSSLEAQGKYAGAEPFQRKALAAYVETLGEKHVDTASSLGSLGANLDAQAKNAEAEPLHRKALAIRLALLGAGHSDTAVSSNNLARCLDLQGRHAEAEPLLRKALAIWLESFGPDHTYTAACYNNLAINLDEQGKYAEAEPFYHKTLVICLKILGEDHRHTATTLANLARNRDDQGKYAEAEPLHRRALATQLRRLGEAHPETARCYANVAWNLDAQGRHVEAAALYRKALAVRLGALGATHRDTANSHASLARNLDAQGKHVEAEALHRKALAIRLGVLGEEHPLTAASYNDLASNLDAQGKLAEAVASWTAAASIAERCRGRRSVSGIERSLASASAPAPALALALAQQGKFRDAWARWENGLARGLLDDFSARVVRPLTPDERRHEAERSGELQRLDERIARLVARTGRTEAEDKELDVQRSEQSVLRGRWVEFQTALDQKYQAYAGKPAPLEDVQKTLPADAALVGWLDSTNHHAACVIRRDREPVWVHVPGSGRDGGFTDAEDDRPARLREALIGHQPGWGAAAVALGRQRLEPLLPHLKGVKRLIVLPSQSLKGVPIETLVAALPEGSPRPVVSYAPSGSMFTRLREPRTRPAGAPRLLAVADPAFPGPGAIGPAPPPPDHGIAITGVAPHGVADLFGLKPGDVLLEYDHKTLESEGDLAVVSAGDRPILVPVKLWRDGGVRTLEIAAGQLGIESNPKQTAAQVVLARRQAATVLRSGAGAEVLSPLPGTRREVEAIAALFPKDRATTLIGAGATESTLQRMAESGALTGYRFLHLATHGKANSAVALSSAIFLAAEPDRPSSSSVEAASPGSALDGRITAEQIVRTWDLDADLVVLSACESGLGRYAGGEGYLGFAQALFVKGARSLVLSLWKVDDKATSFFMARFYQNLLGKRPGLSKPMPKAEALHEAKEWLRNLAADDVGSEPAALDRGRVRPLATDIGGAAQEASPASRRAGLRPYAHPYYWAAFILVGDPD